MESDETLIDVVSDEIPSDVVVTASVDESEEVDILSDFCPSETNNSLSKETSTSAKASTVTDSEEHARFLRTFAGDHNYCSTALHTDIETGESGHESSPKVIVESQQKEVVYCVCRRPDVDQFMIGCDKCDEWYHGSCIGITKKHAKMIKQFFCQACQEKNPELQTKFKKSKENQESETDENPKGKQRRSRRCGECPACKIQEDCGKCDYCLVNSDRYAKIWWSKQEATKMSLEAMLEQICGLNNECNHHTKITFTTQRFNTPVLCRNPELLTKFKKSKENQESETDENPKHLNAHDGSGLSKDEEQQRKMKKIRQPKRRHEDFGGPTNKKHAIKLKHTRHLQGKEQRLKRQLSEKQQRRRKRLASRENSGLYSERTRQTVELPRQCYGPQCQKRARSNSKYCSHECGIQVAVRRIQEILPGRVKEWNETPCIANIKAEQKLEGLKKTQEATRARLLELDAQSKELDEIVERASHLTAVNEEDTETEQDTDIDLNIHCVTCGIALMPKVALRHMEKCYMKNESFTSFGSNFKSVGNLFCDFYNSQQKTYCKRLRVLCPEHTKEPKVSPHEVCGCPLSNDQLEETKDLCCVSKRNCVRHYCWEKLRRAQIDGERVRQWLKLEEAYELEKSTRTAMSQRGGVLSLLLHRTIVEG